MESWFIFVGFYSALPCCTCQCCWMTLQVKSSWTLISVHQANTAWARWGFGGGCDIGAVFFCHFRNTWTKQEGEYFHHSMLIRESHLYKKQQR